MIVQPRRPLVLATALTAFAGFLDAAAYNELNHLYVSFMSGNSTHLGIALPNGSTAEIVGVIIIIAAFVIGACIGTLISDNTKRQAIMVVFTVEVVILVGAFLLALCSFVHLGLVLIALAMGLQNSLHQLVAGADIGKGFITGALFSLGQSLARLKSGSGQGKRAASNFFSWLVFVLGASLGAVTQAHSGLTTCLGAGLAFGVLLLACLRVRAL